MLASRHLVVEPHDTTSPEVTLARTLLAVYYNRHVLPYRYFLKAG